MYMEQDDMKKNSGSKNLELMDSAPNYLKHTARLISKYLPDDGVIVDFGAGNGRQTRLIRMPSPSVLCIEVDEELLGVLQRLGYQTANSLDDVENGSVAAVFSSNCLEHIVDDQSVVKEIERILKPRGVFVVYVPAFPFLYTSMDSRVGHIRRYQKSQLKTIAKMNGLEIVTIRYADSLGVLATLGFKLFGGSSGSPSRWSLRVYDTFFQKISSALDRFLYGIAGKNLLMVAIKPEMVPTRLISTRRWDIRQRMKGWLQ
jgi:SAM-dependent methyltransferase